MANVFNSVQGLHPKFNAFSAHTYRNDFTAPLGVNIPVYLQHVVPNTRVRVETSALIRLMALEAPIMDNIDLYVHFWKCPYRLLENDRFTQFISGEIDPAEYTGVFVSPKSFAHKIIDLYQELYDDGEEKEFYEAITGNGSLLDFLGYDLSLFPKFTIDEGEILLVGGSDEVIEWRELIMYYYVHLNWYMNENVPYFPDFDSLVQDLLSSQSSTELVTLLLTTYYNFSTTFLPHGWEKDYFTSALPNVQFGEPVTLPIVGNAPVSISAGQVVDLQGAMPGTGVYQALKMYISGGSVGDHPDLTSVVSEAGDPQAIGFLRNKANESIDGLAGFLTGNLAGTADLSEASAITINELRFANALQIFKERQMRFGRRRQEYYKGFFDVSPEDLRLQLPKYLGGGRIPINIADIEQTSASTETQKLGHLAGKATAVAGGFAGFTTFCSEESIIIGIAFAMPHITYANGLSRFKLKTNDIYDYFNPSFEHLGEQAIYNIELYGGASQSRGEFGYSPRYNEYRFHANEMHGQFKDTLSFWTLGRIFDSTPALNADFIYMQPSVFNRIFAVSDSDPMLASMLFRQRIVQPVSKYGTPMLLS